MIDLTPRYLEMVQRILAEHVPDCEVRVYGSRVRGTAKPHSDLDLTVAGEEKLPRDRIRLLSEAFDDSTLPFRVECQDWHGISPEFRRVIEEKYEVLQKASSNSVETEG